MQGEPPLTARAVEVNLQPSGKRTRVPAGATVLDATRAAGVQLVSVCGGHGTCGTCRVKPVRGEFSDPNPTEQDRLSALDLRSGWRLACQTRVEGTSRVEIPPESLSTSQRLQTEGQTIDVDLDPPVCGVDLTLTRPSLQDLRADTVRLRDALTVAVGEPVGVGLRLAQTAPTQLRALNWSARAAVLRDGRQTELVSIHRPGSPLLGLAVDIGTTKVAAYLVDLDSGQTTARAAMTNPQIAYGEDVMSRIAYANTGLDAAQHLTAIIRSCINALTSQLCDQSGMGRDQVVDAVMVGNTAMHHLLLGLPVEQLGSAPYVAAMSESTTVPARDLEVELAPNAHVFLPPNIAGFVGADHVAMLMAAGLTRDDMTALAIDIGTNTEISLAHEGQIWSCSTASGPAFEGAHIHDGMRAATGAVERVRFLDGAFAAQTIDDAPAVGICGSGIVDAVAAGIAAGIIDERGALAKASPHVIKTAGGPAFELVTREQAGHGRAVLVTRADVNQIQLAKGAIRAGLQVLLDEASIEKDKVRRVVVAGAFGSYLDVDSAIAIGLLPELPEGRYEQVGNAAGRGAEQLLLSRSGRVHAGDLATSIHYVDLTTHPRFTDLFVQSLMFTARRKSLSGPVTKNRK